MPQASKLVKAFEERADGVRLSDAPLVGIFGEGFPKPIIAAAGGFLVDVKAPPLTDSTQGPVVSVVSAVVEDFMDSFAARFLHRFAAGALNDYAMIIFCRDDVAALAAYQYARELKRQGRVSSKGPQLHLWNMLHTDSEPAHHFNLKELEKLIDALNETLGKRLQDEDLDAAFTEDARRTDIVSQLPVGGVDAFIARNAGRWLSAKNHATLLQEIPASAYKNQTKSKTEHTFALVGTACDIPILHEICSGLGTVIADLQEYGQEYKPDNNTSPSKNDGTTNTLTSMMRYLANDALHIRAAPPVRYTQALIRKVATADLVVASVDKNDDAFGWEIPLLRDRTQDRGGKFIDLGFRPFRPDSIWRDEARSKIEQVLS